MNGIKKVLNIIIIMLIVYLDTEIAWAPASLRSGADMVKDNTAINSMDNVSPDEAGALESRGSNSSSNGKSNHVSMKREYVGNSTEAEAEQDVQAGKAAAADPSYNEYFMTFEEIMAINSISLMDKITGMAILSKLGKKDAEKLISIADSGITMKEFEAVRQLLEDALGREDFEKLIDITEKSKKLYADTMN